MKIQELLKITNLEVKMRINLLDDHIILEGSCGNMLQAFVCEPKTWVVDNITTIDNGTLQIDLYNRKDYHR